MSRTVPLLAAAGCLAACAGGTTSASVPVPAAEFVLPDNDDPAAFAAVLPVI